jgi:molecular chaperone DnaJ
MAKRDYYETLGVPKNANDADLKAAFRKKAMQVHPDKNPGNKDAVDGSQGGGAGFGDFGSTMSDIFEDLFGDVFGGQRQRRGPGGRERGADLRYNMDIALEDAFRGKTASIKVPTSVTCDACSGSGAKPGTKPVTCRSCNGLGRVRAQQGFFAIERTCPTCGGRGETIEDPCTKCSGAGRIMKERQLSVNIPAGVEDGTRIRLANEGEAGARGGPSGDLYIFLSVKPHEFFQRDGADLFCGARRRVRRDDA